MLCCGVVWWGGGHSSYNKNNNEMMSVLLPLPAQPHLDLGKAVQRAQEYLVVYALVVGEVAVGVVSLCSSFHTSRTGEKKGTHKISVNRSCHGGYPLSFTVGENKISKSGSLDTWSLSCASIRSMLICSWRTSPFCAISASVRVRSTIVSRPSCSERRSTVRCWRSLEGDEGLDEGGVPGGEYEERCGARRERVGLRAGPK
jgi:hypothetical protein